MCFCVDRVLHAQMSIQRSMDGATLNRYIDRSAAFDWCGIVVVWLQLAVKGSSRL